jgi:hypothetical protein
MPVTTPAELASLYGDVDHFQHVLDHLFRPALEALSYEAWPPVARGSDLIHHEIIKQLDAADLVLCDMSTLNANVFFELGIRTALNKPVCVVKDNLTTRVPFDVGLVNYYTYEPVLKPWSLVDEIPRLKVHIAESANRSEGRNTLWRRLGIARAGEAPDAGPLDEKVALLLDEVSALSRKIDLHRWTPSVDVPPAPVDDFKVLIEGLPAGLVRDFHTNRQEGTLSLLVSEKMTSEQREALVRRARRLGWDAQTTLDQSEFTKLQVDEMEDAE